MAIMELRCEKCEGEISEYDYVANNHVHYDCDDWDRHEERDPGVQHYSWC